MLRVLEIRQMRFPPQAPLRNVVSDARGLESDLARGTDHRYAVRRLSLCRAPAVPDRWNSV